MNFPLVMHSMGLFFFLISGIDFEYAYFCRLAAFGFFGSVIPSLVMK